MRLLFILTAAAFLFSCSPFKQIGRSAKEDILTDPALRNAHIGISIYEPTTGRYWFNYQGDKYFVPASNTKLPTCYAAMKYLGDSLTGLEYSIDDSFLYFRGSGDPTLLHPDFKDQKVLSFLKDQQRRLVINSSNFTDGRWGSGWAIGDVNESYAPERNGIPVYGNTVRIFKNGDTISSIPRLDPSQITLPHPSNWRIQFERPLNENLYIASPSSQNFTSQEIPFITGNYMAAWSLLMDTLKKEIALGADKEVEKKWIKFRSRPTDSLLKPMMHHSDNFFAEQSLLMVGNELLGVMNDREIIDTLLKTDFKNLPQKPRWVDGSGLSRYNLFSPQDMVFILNKMRTDFGMERIKNILATGNTGTLTNYYVAENGYLFAKTGTLSGVVALSGFLYTKKGKLLILSVLVNNHNTSATQVRRAVEKFVEGIRDRY